MLPRHCVRWREEFTLSFPCISFRNAVFVLKVYNEMQKVNDALNAKPEDATDFLATLESEPGMYCDHTLNAQGRLVDVLATVQQQEQIARFGGCIQLDSTVFTNRCTQYPLRQVACLHRRCGTARYTTLLVVALYNPRSSFMVGGFGAARRSLNASL